MQISKEILHTCKSMRCVFLQHNFPHHHSLHKIYSQNTMDKHKEVKTTEMLLAVRLISTGVQYGEGEALLLDHLEVAVLLEE